VRAQSLWRAFGTARPRRTRGATRAPRRLGGRCRPCGPGCTAHAVQRRGQAPMLHQRRWRACCNNGARPRGCPAPG